ncbi:MAG TPA: methylated-DNA--[protein]-cysteine S-methyltransferase [Opitutales bacterium]|nr:methylated-DNA--[protein]-cysteine S-methyltransferase [Opitutales bacterium]
MKTKKTSAPNVIFELVDQQQVDSGAQGWIHSALPSPWGLSTAAWVEGQGCVFFGITQDVAAVRARLKRSFSRTYFEDRAPQSLGEGLAHAMRATTPSQLFTLRGTAFQIDVWKALLRIPVGKTISYQQIAVSLGRPQSARAVGQAVGANPIAWWVPCHRVLAANNKLGGYAWGVEIKKKMLELEQVTDTIRNHG